jgi:Cytochrome P460
LRPCDPTTRTSRTVIVAALCTPGLLSASAEESSRVSFPDGYRNWFHVKSAAVNEGHKGFASSGGIHHIYANARAMEGYKAGVFPDGSAIVFDLLEFKTNDDKTSTEGARRHVDVMAKDATRFKSTGGWSFEEFQADGRAGSLSDGQAQACASCHASRQDHDSVFSAIRP